MNTHGIKITFGKHSGELITRVPRGYLQWMCNEKMIEPEWRDIAKSELDRRGTELPKLEISGHAIDRASLRVIKKWHKTALDENEGLHSWLMRVGMEAREKGSPVADKRGVVRYLGIQWGFAEGEEFPVLKSVMLRK